MSTVLFVNVDKAVTKKALEEISRIFKQKKVITDVDFCYKGEILGVAGENYCFDSMWVPFLKPLNDFYEKSDNYKQMSSVFEAVIDALVLLINKEYQINLFLASYESKEVCFEKHEIIKTLDLNTNQKFEWATKYKIEK